MENRWKCACFVSFLWQAEVFRFNRNSEKWQRSLFEAHRIRVGRYIHSIRSVFVMRQMRTTRIRFEFEFAINLMAFCWWGQNHFYFCVRSFLLVAYFLFFALFLFRIQFLESRRNEKRNFLFDAIEIDVIDISSCEFLMRLFSVNKKKCFFGFFLLPNLNCCSRQSRYFWNNANSKNKTNEGEEEENNLV